MESAELKENGNSNSALYVVASQLSLRNIHNQQLRIRSAACVQCAASSGMPILVRGYGLFLNRILNWYCM